MLAGGGGAGGHKRHENVLKLNTNSSFDASNSPRAHPERLRDRKRSVEMLKSWREMKATTCKHHYVAALKIMVSTRRVVSGALTPPAAGIVACVLASNSPRPTV